MAFILYSNAAIRHWFYNFCRLASKKKAQCSRLQLCLNLLTMLRFETMMSFLNKTNIAMHFNDNGMKYSNCSYSECPTGKQHIKA